MSLALLFQAFMSLFELRVQIVSDISRLLGSILFLKAGVAEKNSLKIRNKSGSNTTVIVCVILGKLFTFSEPLA